MANLTDYRDADVLDMLVPLTELRDQVEIARRRESTAYNRTVRATCKDYVALNAKVASTTARTSAGQRAHALHALRGAEPDPDLPSGGFSAVVFSALYDIVQAGGL